MAALFAAMAFLAFLPSVSVLAVTSRAAASGFTHGVFTTLGIVAGDIVFILLAIAGLSVLAGAMDGLFVAVKYLGGAYVVWLGIRLWRNASAAVEPEKAGESSLWSSFVTGLLITLADQKAILFYLGFLPAFMDLESVSLPDTVIVIAIAVVAVGGAKLVYAWTADRAGLLVDAGARRWINVSAGGLMIAVGLVVIVKA